MALTNEQIGEQIEDVLEQLRPYFLMHGGQIAFDRFDAGKVYVRLSGACGGCPPGIHSSCWLKLSLKKKCRRSKKLSHLMMLNQHLYRCLLHRLSLHLHQTFRQVSLAF